MNKVIENKVDIAKRYMNEVNEKWGNITNNFYVCYSLVELATDTIYKLFEKDSLNEMRTFYRKNGKQGTKILCELEENVYFQFDIFWVVGLFGDSGFRINNGKFRIFKEVPKGWNDIWELLDNDDEEKL